MNRDALDEELLIEISRTQREFGNFALAAENLKCRYYRRFPNASLCRVDATTIKSRWYNRGTCHVVRERLGN